MELLNCVLTSLRQINRGIALHSKSINKEIGLTGPQLVLMKIIQSHGAEVTTIKRLAEEANSSQATATIVINGLEKKGLITRVRSQEDQRIVITRLTQAGENLLSNITHTAMPYNFSNNFRLLPESEQFMLIYSLKKINELML